MVGSEITDGTLKASHVEVADKKAIPTLYQKRALRRMPQVASKC